MTASSAIENSTFFDILGKGSLAKIFSKGMQLTFRIISFTK